MESLSGETEEKQSAWTTDTLREFLLSKVESNRVFFQHQHDDLVGMLDERYETQTKAIDAAFAAQQLAMQTALIAQEKAILAALASTKEAIGKKETSDEKRFEAVNEFRGQLADQASTLMSRVEAEARIVALLEKFDSAEKANTTWHQLQTARIAEIDQRVTSRLDLTQGKSDGTNNTIAFLFAFITITVAVAAVVITLVSLN